LAASSDKPSTVVANPPNGPTDEEAQIGEWHETLVRVRYSETDKMGVVYYANYLVWFEVGRTELLRNAGWSYREMETERFSLPVLEAHCEYKQPARYDDELDVHATGALLSGVRVEFTYDLIRAADDVALAAARTVHASIDRQGRPCRLPDRIRELFA